MHYLKSKSKSNGVRVKCRLAYWMPFQAPSARLSHDRRPRRRRADACLVRGATRLVAGAGVERAEVRHIWAEARAVAAASARA